MATGQASGFRRIIFWDHPRGGWQYDIIVGLILAFIFLTPRELFRDQPKAPSVVLLPTERGSNVFWVEPDLLEDVPPAAREARAQKLVQDRFGKKFNLVHLEAIYDAEQEIKGYMAYAKP
jgi:hypothetical protein